MQSPREVTLQSKLEFLLRPDSYPDQPRSIESIETHFAWVFLSEHFVYKLKKPIRFQHMDFTNLETRRGNCELEVALNRRLADIASFRFVSGIGAILPSLLRAAEA